MAEIYSSISRFYGLMVSFVGCGAVSLCLWVLFGERARERPVKCGVSMAHIGPLCDPS